MGRHINIIPKKDNPSVVAKPVTASNAHRFKVITNDVLNQKRINSYSYLVK